MHMAINMHLEALYKNQAKTLNDFILENKDIVNKNNKIFNLS